MAGDGEQASGRAWHQALAYAVTGRPIERLCRQASPSVPVLVSRLEHEVGREALLSEARRRVHGGQAWPFPVPADLMAGLGPAQFAAALALLQQALGLDPASWAARVGQDQPVTREDRRLLDEVPPHHGS